MSVNSNRNLTCLPAILDESMGEFLDVADLGKFRETCRRYNASITRVQQRVLKEFRLCIKQSPEEARFATFYFADLRREMRQGMPSLNQEQADQIQRETTLLGCYRKYREIMQVKIAAEEEGRVSTGTLLANWARSGDGTCVEFLLQTEKVAEDDFRMAFATDICASSEAAGKSYTQSRELLARFLIHPHAQALIWDDYECAIIEAAKAGDIVSLKQLLARYRNIQDPQGRLVSQARFNIFFIGVLTHICELVKCPGFRGQHGLYLFEELIQACVPHLAPYSILCEFLGRLRYKCSEDDSRWSDLDKEVKAYLEARRIALPFILRGIGSQETIATLTRQACLSKRSPEEAEALTQRVLGEHSPAGLSQIDLHVNERVEALVLEYEREHPRAEAPVAAAAAAPIRRQDNGGAAADPS